MPRSWNIKKIFRLDSKDSSAGKKKNEMKPETLNSSLIPTNTNKKGRSASQEEKTKLTWSKINGKTNLPYSNVSDIPSTDDWTSSTDYSPSSRSFTNSSASGSIDNENLSQQLAIRNLDSKVIKPDLSNGESPVNINTGDGVNHSNTSFENIGNTNNPNQIGIDKSNSMMADCSNISDYVENALFASNTMTPDHSETIQNGDHEQPSSHRINLFHSSSSLSRDSERPLDVAAAEPYVAGLRPDIVTLDFVKSAAQTFKSSSTSNNEDADSYSSLTSSFMSSVDSHDGSSIDSDVVEDLYSKIAAATAKHKLKLMNSESNKVNHQQAEVFNDKHLDINASGTKCDNCSGTILQPDQNKNENDSTAGTCRCDEEDSKYVVEELDLSNSNLKVVPDDIYQHAETLISLSLESNAITDLPKELFDCRNLHELYVADNDIAILPPNLAGLTKLRHLDISKNVIEDIPECMPCLKNLVVLDASVNPIEKLSESFTQLMNLQELYMNDCFFDYLPASFGRMSELKVLELRDNQLQILPKSIRRLLHLCRLDLGGNVLQDWPDVISKLTSLRELWLDCNELNKVSNDIGDLTELVYLDLSRNFLQSIPNQISSLFKLTDLLLAENNLTSLPDNIGFLRSLTVINLEHNQLEKLPDSFGKLESLEEVDISHNKLLTLPSSIGKLKNLKMLLLDNNQLQDVPEELGCCIMLSVLQLSRNKLECLPESFGNLKNLRVLNICQNRIPFLPITLRNLNQLEALWISPNQSKPSIPVQVEVDPETGCQILTNVLFPQEEGGLSRASKILGSINSRDSQDYAIDAADDDDLDEYSRKERGTTQVVFDLNATTYSDVWESMQAERYANEEDQVLSSEVKDRSPVEKNKNVAVTLSDMPFPDFEEKKRIQRQTAISDYAIAIPKQHQASGLSVSFEEIPPTASPKGVKFSQNPISIAPCKPRVSAEEEKQIESFQESNYTSHDKTSSSVHKYVQISKFQGGNMKETSTGQASPQITEDRACKNLALDNKAINHKDEKVTITGLENFKPKIPEKPANLRTKECHAPTDSSLATTVDKHNLFLVNHTASNSTKNSEEASISDRSIVRPQSMEDDVFGGDIEQVESTSKEKAGYFVENRTVVSEKAENDVKLDLSQFQYIDNDESNDLAPVEDNLTVSDGAIPTPYIIEDKPSSVTSGESVTATDDSGVGFIDAESHEDNEMDVVVISKGSAPKIRWKSTTVTPPHQAYEPNVITRQSESTISPEHTVANAVYNQSPPVESKTNRSSTSTTNVADQITSRPRKPPVPPPPVAKKNLVSLNIKKFEKQSDNASVSNKNNSVLQHTAPLLKGHQVFHIAKLSDAESKPMAIATILPQETNEPPKLKASVNDGSSDPHSPNDRNVSEVLQSLDLYTKTDITETQVPSQSEAILQDQTPDGDQELSQNGNASPRIKPVHVRKSKFDEALAATKHKNFREKLEKAMQQQQNQSSLTNSVKRLSRGSTSSIASIPRITSPVPHQHDYFLDSVTADHTTNTPPQQTPNSSTLHLKLKEKLHPPSTRTKSFGAKADVTSHVHRINRKESVQHNSHMAASKSREIDQNPPKLSLEEQLGQLCLDGSSQSPPHGKHGFVNYLPDEYCQSTSTRNVKRSSSKEKSTSITNSSSENYRRPSKPEDWKHQLLEYLELKKSTTVFPSDKSASFGNLPRRDIPRHIQNVPDHEPHFSKSSERVFAKPEESTRIGHAPNTKPSQYSKLGGDPRATRSSSSISHFAAPLHSKQPGRRIAGKYQRTRTPGPEFNSSEPKVDLAIRPKSAMDRPIRTSDPFDPFSEISAPLAPLPNPEYMRKNFPVSSVVIPTPAPPSYHDHISRHVVTSGGSQEDQQNYVNLEYFHNRLRASMRDKRHENRTNQQASVAHVPYSNLSRNAIPKQPPIRGSEQAYLHKRQQIRPTLEGSSRVTTSDHPHTSEPPLQQQLHESQQQRAYQAFQADKQHYANPAFVPHPNPPREPYPNQYSQYHAKSIPNNHSGKHVPHQLGSQTFTDRGIHNGRGIYDSHAVYDDPYRVHMRLHDSRSFHQAITNPDFSNYSEVPYTVQPTMQQEFMVNNENAASAFRPYQQQQLIRPRQNQSYKPANMYYPTRFDDGKATYGQPVHYDQHHYQPSMDLLDGYQHQKLQFKHPNEDRVYPQRQTFHKDNSNPYMDPYEPSHHVDQVRPMHDAMEMAVEVFSVTVKKNPNFGFHIMGGVDSGGNPFRPDDDGVFITYVALGGAADGLVQPGDKILMVNGSEFIGIDHKRAVDLLRNAGLAAKLVVERLVGRPV